ncbi:MAG: nucleotidyl transferase AbiEii/AbiGii toxin family protein [Gammaproteobacteria bacterium]|nr:MAG: nucleotidyl transferase AbiEii/AbiGii toxin family protein [Gammaproteobacteria bacterium]
MTTGLARSVQVRLVQHAKKLGIDPNVVLVRYASERLLYRLSQSPHGERFVLKGALLLLVWLGEKIRPTRDADLLGFGELDAESLCELFGEVCAQPVEPDGLEFDPVSLRVAPIRVEDAYGGQRVQLTARLGKARLRVQVDVGIGDAVVPEPQWIEYPSLLNLPRPRLRAYRPETAIAEKLHAMVTLGAANSRMRDFFDVHALTRKFAEIPGKSAQWMGFTRRLLGGTPAPELAAVIDAVAVFAGPALQAVAHGEHFAGSWSPGGPWR